MDHSFWELFYNEPNVKEAQKTHLPLFNGLMVRFVENRNVDTLSLVFIESKYASTYYNLINYCSENPKSLKVSALTLLKTIYQIFQRRDIQMDSRMVEHHQDTKEHRVESLAKLWTGNDNRYT